MSSHPAAVGVADHNGWAVLVCVAAPDSAPRVLDRRRVELLDVDLPSQPYHHETLQLETEPAQALVRCVRASATQQAAKVLATLQADIGTDFEIVSIALREGVFSELPASVREVHQSHALTYAADGLLYRIALRDAALARGVEAIYHPSKAELTWCATALNVKGDQITSVLDSFGRILGPPWRKDHRQAATAALGALSKIAVDIRLGPGS